MSEKATIAERFREAGLNDERFIQCQPGEKGSLDHTRRHHDEVSGNYGIYALASDGVAILDIDDYGELDNRDGLKALSELEPTLEQGSPHDGTHRIYAIQPTEDGRMVSEVLEEHFGSKNPNPSWGEVRTANQYVVGAGSQLDGCDKDWCEECSHTDGGHYVIQSDRRIATHTADELVAALEADPDLQPDEEDTDDQDDNSRDELPDVEADDGDLLEFALEVDDKLARLWRGNYSAYGGDRSEAECALAMKLGWWFQHDKQTVRRLMDKSSAEKWHERDDESYRDSVLEAVDQLGADDHYDPSEYSTSDPAEFDPEAVQRGVAILNAETAAQSPAGELVYQNGCYGYEKTFRDSDGNPQKTVFDTVCNFTIETLSYLSMEDGQQLKLRIHPQHPMEDHYDVRVDPSVFNSAQTFKEEIVRGRTTAFEPSNRAGKPVAAILGDLRRTVGSQMAPQRTGSEFIGLSDDYSEWVTPEGSITADGWAADPEYEYYTKTGEGDESGAIAQKWRPTPDDQAVDSDDLREMLELLPQTRQTDRGLPVLGWFYAAPLKPLITDWSGEFNILQVTGETGSGKTTTLQAFWQLFGADENPFSASDTGFTIEKHMAESCGLPVWIDEYKPTDIPDYRLDRLHRRLREVTRERTISKGTQNLDEITFTIRAPVVISGEQKFKEAAVRRRAIMTNLTQAATEDGSETAEAFGKLTGTSYEDDDGEEQYPAGYDLSQHAVAYYQWLLQQDAETLEAWWHEANETTKDILGSLGVTVENTEQQGLKTVVFGTQVFTAFAEAHGVDDAALPGRSDLRAALRHIVSNIGKDGSRREHTDEWLELLTLAANEGYIEHGHHFKVTDSRKHGQKVLDVHMPSAFSSVKKYLREFNIEGEYTTLSKGDYLDAFKNKSDQSDSFVIDTNVSVRGLENGRKCVRFDPGRAGQKLGSDFELSAFAETEIEEEEDGEEAEVHEIEALAALDLGFQNEIVAEVSSADAGEYSREAQGTLKGAHGTFLSWVIPGDNDDPITDVEGESVRIQHAKIRTNQDGLKELVINDATEVTPLDDSDAISLSEASETDDKQPASDGGTAVEADTEDDLVPEQLVVQLATAKVGQFDGVGIPRDELQSLLVERGVSESKADHVIEKRLQDGALQEPQADRIRRT